MSSDENTRPRTHDDYTVGWVCALPKEQTAATAMLDHKHADLLKPPNDPNVYTLGSIGGHNIVIACLPKGKTGTSSAATVAAWVISTFPSIKIGLMVGIGGGVPPKVRLGDVVVSTPSGQFPGVVQWDFGKAEADGSFERTGWLNNPPTSLLAALSKLETEHELNGSKIPEYLDELKAKFPRLASKYLRSDSLEDVLFRADYGHVGKITDHGVTSGINDVDEGESCQFCDRSQVVKKKLRDMRVHYGLIASGNQVIKDATFRDRLNKDLGGQVLCVEMEAAGLMNNFPCIVIRGICDYADSHKNKDWQEHAATVAAAFAKELLGYIQTKEMERERPVRDVLGQVLDVVCAVEENAAHTRARLDREEDVKILDWLTTIDYGPQQSDYFQRQELGTGQWLLHSEEFQAWIATSKQTLFCQGMPGAGKTILTSAVVHYLDSTFHNMNVGIAYVYCNFRRKHEQGTADLLASILKQLAETQVALPESVRELYQKHKNKRTRPSLDELCETLHSVIISSYMRVFVIIDALDECQTTGNCRAKFLSQIFKLQSDCDINIFATSRVIPEIAEKFKESKMVEIRAHDDDVKKYLDSQISHSGLEILALCRETITTEITKAVQGMFLLAQLYFEAVKTRKTQKKIKDTLRNLPTGSKAYDYAYEEAMKRITDRDALLALAWIICSTRPITTLELQHALAVEVKKHELDEGNLLQIKDLVSLCSGLVTIDEESDIIRLVHYTTQEYFERTQRDWFPEAESSITAICVTYLSFDAFEAGACATKWEYTERLRLYPLFNYAAQNWGYHAQRSQILRGEDIDFLESRMKAQAAAQPLFKSWSFAKNLETLAGMTGLHLAAYFGVSEAVHCLLHYESDMNSRDGSGKTPLIYAAENGHKNVAELFIATGQVRLDAKDYRDRTPLFLAAKNGHTAVVKLLIATGLVNINAEEIYSNQTPLSIAAQNGHKDVVELLIATGQVRHDAKEDYFGGTPLSRAAENGHKDIVELLKTVYLTRVNRRASSLKSQA